MLITEMRHRLECLGWRTFDNEIQLASGRWRLFAYRRGHIMVALADSREEVWSAACSMAMKLTRNGLSDGGETREHGWDQ